MLRRSSALKTCVGALAGLAMMAAVSVDASQLVQQTWLPGDCIPKFAAGLPIFGPGTNAALPRVNAALHPLLTITMKETSQGVLPPNTADFASTATYFDTLAGVTANCPAGITVQPTRVWGYESKDSVTNAVLGPAHWPSVTIEAVRDIPTVATYVNEAPSFDINNPTGAGLVQGLVTIDQTIDWADPLGNQAAHMCNMWPPMTPLDPACLENYAGNPAPMITHLHGAEVASQYDGGPQGWFTSTGLMGPGYNTLFNAGPGTQVSYYQNSQEAGTLWIHDHVMGQTRTNVYSGPAAFYFLRSPGQEPSNLPKGAYEIELAFQDRQFDTNSQLFWPDGSGTCGTGMPAGPGGIPAAVTGDPCLNGAPPNPTIHPYWIPEFMGDTVIVNGAPWPYVNVEPRRYRLRMLAGSNARMWRMNFGSVPVYAIGSDDNYLDAPVPAATSTLPGQPNIVFIAPGERMDVIVDFTNFSGQSITVTNDANAPFPVGMIPGVDQPGMAQIMQFNVNLTKKGKDTSCNPAIAGQCIRPKAMVRLTDGQGNIAPGVKIDKHRQLILKEIASPAGPVMVTVNNTLYMGNMSPSINLDVFPDGMTETPAVGSTEEWEIINLTMDAHPMHTHLVQFQVLNRESFQDGSLVSDTKNYPFDWAAAFPAYAPWTFPAGFTWENPALAPNDFASGCTGGVFCPGYGPPLPYEIANADGAVGGNPAIGPYLRGDAAAPDAWESGWKDTAKAYPGQVLRMIVRWTPTSTKVNTKKSWIGNNFFPFDPTKGPGYVWHCHIIDHEDNDMMRPYKVTLDGKSK